MDDSQEVYTSDEEKDISQISEDLTVEDSSASDNNESLVQKPKTKFKKRAVIISDSEDDEEEERFERQALSPRTRMSITGIRPADLSSNSSEFDDSSEDEETENSDAGDESYKENPFLRDVEVKNSFHESNYSVSEKEETSSSQSETETPTKNNQSLVINPKSRPSNAKYSTIFGNSLEDKLSSTMMVPEKVNESQSINDNLPSKLNSEEPESNNSQDSAGITESTKDELSTLNPEMKTINDSSGGSTNVSNESDLVEIQKTQDIVDISSDDSDEVGLSNSRPLKHEMTKTVQPKISAALSRVTLSDKGSNNRSETETPTKNINQSLTINHPRSRTSLAQYSSIFGHSLEDQLSSTVMVPEKLNESESKNDNTSSIVRSEEPECNNSQDYAGKAESTKDDLSSTLNPETKTYDVKSKESTNLSSASDLFEIQKSQGIIVDISSDDSDEVVFVDSKPLKHGITNTVQPKISAALSQVPPSKEDRGSNNKTRVSKEYHEKELKKLDELRLDLAKAESLLETVGPSLFDGGKQLSIRVASLQNSIKKKAEEIVNLIVEDDVVVEDKKKPFFDKDLPNWDDLSAAVNAIKPVFTGKQGLNTFNTQKVLTMERLKDIHGSLETCPGDDVQADDPKGLKISLMPHQKHALAWMNWREHQKPRGGILADDMGLGKTLSMISLVLDVKNREENDEEDDGDSEEENNGWSTKGRRDYHNGGTLIVCPASLIRQWESEVNSRVHRHKLSISVHHGQSRDTKPRHLATYDIVITTYQIVAREFKTKGALFSIAWKRIILDEAHVVRNYKSQSSLAVCELRAKCRWALTGTPIQNKEIDVYALLKFLKCSPFDDLAHWKKWIDNKSTGGHQRLNTLMKSLMLRRTKVQLQQQGSLACLPERAPCKIIEVNLDKDEMNVYQKIMTYSKTLFAQFLYQRAEKNNDMYFLDQGSRPTFMQTKDPNGAYNKMHQKFSKLHHGERDIKSHEILVLLLRLRQICCHPGLIDAMLEDEDESLPTDSYCSEPEIDLLDQLNKLAINDNSASNLTDSVDENQENKGISRASARVLQRSNPVFNLSRPSSKMKKVLQIVDEEILKTSDKAIIVSQWTSTLNILKTHFAQKNVRTLSLNGSILVKNRQDIVTEFNDPNSSSRILLLSLTAGGVGLNLIGANHLLLIDLHWNPQLESQAQDRIYRVGQKKTVHIYKFMCKDTVEERIKALQDHKLELANGILTGAKVTGGSKLSIDDLKGLFGL